MRSSAEHGCRSSLDRVHPEQRTSFGKTHAPNVHVLLLRYRVARFIHKRFNSISPTPCPGFGLKKFSVSVPIFQPRNPGQGGDLEIERGQSLYRGPTDKEHGLVAKLADVLAREETMERQRSRIE